jgi:hypothetical protein
MIVKWIQAVLCDEPIAEGNDIMSYVFKVSCKQQNIWINKKYDCIFDSNRTSIWAVVYNRNGATLKIQELTYCPYYQ